MSAEPSDTPETDALNSECCSNSSASGHLLQMLGHARSLERRLREAEAALAKARDEALEDAAKIVETSKVGEELVYGHVTEAWIARAIRAKIKEGK